MTTHDGWRRYYCPVCGHVEWVPPGEDLPADYHCPLCEAKRKAMVLVGDTLGARHGIAIEPIAAGVCRIRKRPPYRADFEHFAYALEHPEGLVLFDAPHVPSSGAVAAVRALGQPRALILSHEDFVGFAADWSKLLGVPAWMGAGALPIPGNRFTPDEWIDGPRRLAPDLELLRVPGHSPGELALYWSGAPDGPVLVAGDALTVWTHRDGRVQLAFLQNPPVSAEARALAERPVALLCTCTGTLAGAGEPLRRLLASAEPCARPYLGDRGGVWLEAPGRGRGFD
jgi:glyoxylase-like metal-dependent hydrolase (beta-lactamase superfamily II)/rubredoxin